MPLSRASSTDSSGTEVIRKVITDDTILGAMTFMHISKEIKKMLLDKIEPSYKDELKKDFYVLFYKHKFHLLESASLQEAREIVEKKCQDIANDSMSIDAFIKFVEDLRKKVDPVAKERARAEQAETRAEQAETRAKQLEEMIKQLQQRMGVEIAVSAAAPGVEPAAASHVGSSYDTYKARRRFRRSDSNSSTDSIRIETGGKPVAKRPRIASRGYVR